MMNKPAVGEWEASLTLRKWLPNAHAHRVGCYIICNLVPDINSSLISRLNMYDVSQFHEWIMLARPKSSYIYTKGMAVLMHVFIYTVTPLLCKL